MHDRGLLQVKQYERPFWGKKPYIPTAFNQENALLNWRKRMAERKKMQGHISGICFARLIASSRMLQAI